MNLTKRALVAEEVDVVDEEIHDDSLPTLVWQMTMADLNALTFHHIAPLTNLPLHVHDYRLRLVFQGWNLLKRLCL